MTWQDKQEIRRANPNKYTDRDMCVIEKESWPKASFEKPRQASDDKRSVNRHIDIHGFIIGPSPISIACE